MLCSFKKAIVSWLFDITVSCLYDTTVFQDILSGICCIYIHTRNFNRELGLQGQNMMSA